MALYLTNSRYIAINPFFYDIFSTRRSGPQIHWSKHLRCLSGLLFLRNAVARFHCILP
jgi:hypothetical protein